MRVIEGIDKIIAVLKPHMKEIEDHFNNENEKFKSLIESDSDSIGKILKCHLIIEHYLNRFISDFYQINDISKVKLTFYQKAKLIPDNKTAASFVKPGILKINNIRNRVVHQLYVNLDEIDTESIDIVLNIAREGIRFKNQIEKIEAFTTIACTFLIIPPPNLQQLFIEAFSEVRSSTNNINGE